MSDFDKVKVGDWVRIESHFDRSGVRLPHTVAYEGFVVETSGLSLFRLSTEQGGSGVWIGTTPAAAVGVESVQLAEHRPVREVGWHEVSVPVGPLSVAGLRVLWWDGQEWRRGPGARTPDAVNVLNDDSTYLGKGSM